MNAVQNIDATLKSLLKVQEDTEKAVKEAGEALRIYIEKSAIIHSNRQQTSIKLPVAKNGEADVQVKPPGKKKNFDNKMSLKATIKGVLARSSNGVKIGDIIDSIELEKLWQTTGDLESQVQSNLYSMKKSGLITRDEDNNYRLS